MVVCRKCPVCRVEPRIRQGEPVKVGDKAYWRQVFTCSDPQVSCFNEDVMQVDINIFDNSEVVEKEL